MDQIKFFALLSFMLVTTFTPGPNNISCASMGLLHGYRKSIPYMLGISSGVFVLFSICAIISNSVMTLLPSFEILLRLCGAAYILWLAHKTLRASYSFQESEQEAMGLAQGILLQFLNPKAIIFGLTLYSVFLASIAGSPVWLLLSVILQTALTFASVSAWALFGSTIRRYLVRPRLRQAINLVLALLLVYTALEISGLVEAIL